MYLTLKIKNYFNIDIQKYKIENIDDISITFTKILEKEISPFLILTPIINNNWHVIEISENADYILNHKEFNNFVDKLLDKIDFFIIENQELKNNSKISIQIENDIIFFNKKIHIDNVKDIYSKIKYYKNHYSDFITLICNNGQRYVIGAYDEFYDILLDMIPSRLEFENNLEKLIKEKNKIKNDPNKLINELIKLDSSDNNIKILDIINDDNKMNLFLEELLSPKWIFRPYSIELFLNFLQDLLERINTLFTIKIYGNKILFNCCLNIINNDNYNINYLYDGNMLILKKTKLNLEKDDERRNNEVIELTKLQEKIKGSLNWQNKNHKKNCNCLIN